MLIDTHAHLNFPDFEKDLDSVINNSLQNGVKKIICVSSNLADSQKTLDIVRHYPGIVSAAVGIHPQQTDPDNSTSLNEQIETLAQLASHKEVVAIGECGLDFSPAPPGEKDRTIEEQIWLFEAQIQLAKKMELPLILHCRKATEQVLTVLSRHFHLSNRPNGVWHFYSGGKNNIAKVRNLGFYFGLDGNLTYEEGLQNVARFLPLTEVVLETDSPFLSPIPHRGLRNEPANVKMIADFLARLLNKSVDEVGSVTSQNAQKLFHQA